ncbi:MAG: hypothetical protein WC551_05870 [Patescibacteria group bacterium]
MKKLSEMTARELIGERARNRTQIERFEGLMSKPSRVMDYSGNIAEHETKIREINSELVRRAMVYENQAVTLPRCMVESITAGCRGGDFRAMTVTELMAIRNDAVVRSGKCDRRGPESVCFWEYFESQIRLVDNEIERRVCEAEEFNEKARRGFMDRIHAS